MVDGSLHFRHFLAIVPKEFSTHGSDALRKLVYPQSPHAEIGFVDALVAHIAIAIVPMPVPVVVNKVFAERTHWCRPAPEVVVQSRRNWRDALVANVWPSAVHQSARHVYPTNQSFFEVFHRFADGHRAAQLHTVLNNAVVFIGRFDHLLALVNIVCGGLFHVNVFTCLTGPDGLQCMPVVRCGKRYGINIFVFVNFSEVLFYGHFLAVFLFKIGSSNL